MIPQFRKKYKGEPLLAWFPLKSPGGYSQAATALGMLVNEIE
jgi:hypothetical protein